MIVLYTIHGALRGIRGSAPCASAQSFQRIRARQHTEIAETGREPDAGGRHEVRRAMPVPQQVPGTDFSDCAIGMPILVQFRSDRLQSLRPEIKPRESMLAGR
jgi:hypothetical protein